jgi:hypothetical protein
MHNLHGANNSTAKLYKADSCGNVSEREIDKIMTYNEYPENFNQRYKYQ